MTELTGITDKMLVGKPKTEDAVRSFIEFTDGLPLIGHNIKTFDLRYILPVAEYIGVPVTSSYFDTLIYARKLKCKYDWENCKMEYLTAKLGIKNEVAHRAWSDAKATAELYERLKTL